MKKILVILSLLFGLTLLNSQSVFADSIQSYEFSVTGIQSENLTLYTTTGSNPYNFTPQYISVEFTNTSSTPCGYFANYNFRIYNNGLSNVAAQVRTGIDCTSSASYFNVEQFTHYSSFTGFYVPSGDFKSTLSYKIIVYSGSPISATPDCPDCPDCDDPAIVRMFTDGFWSVATAFVSLIVPVLALFLVFRLVHDFFWGRG